MPKRELRKKAESEEPTEEVKSNERKRDVRPKGKAKEGKAQGVLGATSRLGSHWNYADVDRSTRR